MSPIRCNFKWPHSPATTTRRSPLAAAGYPAEARRPAASYLAGFGGVRLARRVELLASSLDEELGLGAGRIGGVSLDETLEVLDARVIVLQIEVADPEIEQCDRVTRIDREDLEVDRDGLLELV